MSGIAGIFHPNGCPVRLADLDSMVGVMAHRGPDGSAVWGEGPVGLGHCMLHTTPESLHEVLPRATASGALAITAEARIDNREALYGLLRLTGRLETISDSELILAAYEKWGEACVEHLLGDFAFAIWDAKRQTLFCARDHLGINQLYYHYRPGRLFAFGSEIKALFALSEVEEQLDEVVFGEYFTRKLSDSVRTVFKDVLRLGAGHAMTVSPEGLQTWRYWELKPAPQQHLSDEAYTARFLELFKEAVACRLRSAFPVGSELSGGLDSSFVTCVARDLLQARGAQPLQTISLVYDRFQECDERKYIEEVVKTGGIEPHFVSAEEQGLLQLLDEIFGALDDGRAGGNHHLNWLTSRAASQRGIRVLLTGQDGDTTVFHGWQYFIELVRDGRWDDFVREAEQVVGHLQAEQGEYATQETFRSPADALSAYGGIYLKHWATRGNYWRLLQAVRQISRRFSIAPRQILRGLWREALLPQRVLEQRRSDALRQTMGKRIPRIVNPEFARRIQLGDRLLELERAERPHLTVREAQRSLITSPYLAATFEKFSSYAGAWGIEARHPFMDKRLVEYCVSLPPEQSLKNGWTRIIMRRAMQHIVPEEICWRAGKSSLAAPYAYLLFDADAAPLEALMQHMGRADRYIDTAYARELYGKGKKMNSEEMRMFGLAVSLSYWMQKRDGMLNSTEASDGVAAPAFHQV